MRPMVEISNRLTDDARKAIHEEVDRVLNAMSSGLSDAGELQITPEQEKTEFGPVYLCLAMGKRAEFLAAACRPVMGPVAVVNTERVQ